MGGIRHLVDFNEPDTRRKLSMHKRHSNGMEAPRNSLELPFQTPMSYSAIHENIPNSYQLKPSSLMSVYPSEVPTKNLIEEDISKQTTAKQNVPSVIARLMGMDMLPTDMKSMSATNGRKHESSRTIPLKQQDENGSTRQSLSKSVKQVKQDLFTPDLKEDRNHSRIHSKPGKPLPRYHPQEEQLQMFKKEFEAWQAAKIWERSGSVEIDYFPKKKKDIQVLAQENLNREKMARYSNADRDVTHGLPITESSQIALRRDRHWIDLIQPNQREKVIRSDTRKNVEMDQRSLKCGQYSKPTRIVILKPGTEGDLATDESWASSSESGKSGIEDFLLEVKERLALEIQGKGQRNATARGGRVETCFPERLVDPKQIAQHIAKQVRENVTRDLRMNLLRSESAGSCRSELDIGPVSLELIKDRRKLSSPERMYVMQNETGARDPLSIGGQSRKIETKEPYKRAGSFRHEEMDNARFETGGLSPTNLARSLSAPVAGTSVVTLLSKGSQSHVTPSTQSRRKVETNENVLVGARTTRKEKFNIKERMSNLRYSFTLKGKLFGKKIQTSGECGAAAMRGQENYTEVPPSPASVCSSAQEELLRPGDHPSPVSTLDDPFVEDHSVSQVFREISSDLHELRRHLNELQSDGSDQVGISKDEGPCTKAEIVNLEGQAYIYIRDVLIAAGLYNGDAIVTKPIDYLVFKDVEEAYRNQDKEMEGAANINSEGNIKHKVLFDLLNEALTITMRPCKSTFMRRVLSPTAAVSPGKKLLDDVWRIIRVYVYPQTDAGHLLDGMVGYNIGMTNWPNMMNDEANEIGRTVELMILRDLVEEVMREMRC